VARGGAAGGDQDQLKGKKEKKMARFSLAAALAFLMPVAAAYSADYPSRPVRLIVPYAAGGNADIVGRLVGQRLAESLGQAVVIDNRGGANSIIGTAVAAKSPPDGHTILIVAPAIATNPSMVKELPYDALRDLAPISLVGSTPIILVAHPSLPARTLKELIALARARPGQLNFASSGHGSPANLAGALMNLMAGIHLVHVTYKGTAQATSDVIAGHMHLGFPSMTSVLPHVKAGKLKAIGITGLKRSQLAPDIPTVAEGGLPGYQASIWNGLLAPAGTPKPIIARLHAEMVKGLGSPETRARFAGLGSEVETSSPGEFRAFIESETTKWARVIKESGIRVELER
jgi:tripartite-type tricarboxylate transporter receptor subunit TctC